MIKNPFPFLLSKLPLQLQNMLGLIKEIELIDNGVVISEHHVYVMQDEDGIYCDHNYTVHTRNESYYQTKYSKTISQFDKDLKKLNSLNNL